MKHLLMPFLLAGCLAAGCQQKKENAQGVDTGKLDCGKDSMTVTGNPKLLYALPEQYNTPDGVVVA